MNWTSISIIATNLSSSNDNMDEIDFTAHAILMPAILAVGFVGQTLNLITLSQKYLKAPCFVYLKSVAWAELLSIFFLVPFVVRHALKWNRLLSLRPYWVLWYEAHLEIPFINAFVAANSLSIAALTLDRYFSVCHPLLARAWFANPRRAQIVSFILYVLSILIFIPACFQKYLIATLDVDGQNVTISVRNHDLHMTTLFQLYLIFRETLVRIGPIIVVIILNILILVAFRRATLKRRRLKRSSDMSSTSMTTDLSFFELTVRGSRTESKRATASEQRVRKGYYDKQRRFYALLTITVLTFLICTLPASILSLLITNRMTSETSVGFQAFRAAANLLEAFSYCTNFYIYCMCSSDYRQAFLNKLGLIRTDTPVIQDTMPTVLQT